MHLFLKIDDGCVYSDQKSTSRDENKNTLGVVNIFGRESDYYRK